MPNTIGKFDFEVTKITKEQLFFPPSILICLKEYGQYTRDGAPALSTNLMTEQEIVDYVTLLKEDLDAVAARAQRALKKALKDTQDIALRRDAGQSKG